MKLDLGCDDVSRLISEGLDQSLSGPERTRMRLHFIICETCRNVDEQMQFLRSAMRQLGRDDKRPPED
jgi:hypothetical protein